MQTFISTAQFHMSLSTMLNRFTFNKDNYHGGMIIGQGIGLSTGIFVLICFSYSRSIQLGKYR